MKSTNVHSGKLPLVATAVFAAFVSYWTLSNWNSAPAFNNDIESARQLFSFSPHLSILLNDLVLAAFGTTGQIVLGFIIFPTISFFVLFKIFNRHIGSLWSLAISVCALVSYSNYPFRQFLGELMTGMGWAELSSVRHLEIMGFPIPAFSTFYFLTLFYFSTSTQSLVNVRRATVLTTLWALFIQIHPVDAIFGLTFWFTYLPIRLYRQRKGAEISQIAKTVLQQVAIAFIITLPAILGLKETVLETPASAFIPSYYYVVYFILPIFAMTVIYFVQRVDPFEIIFKFWHVYMLILVEFTLVALADMFRFGIHPEIIQTRIPLFLLHFYYYVPVIYFSTKPYQEYSIGPEAHPVSIRLHKAVHMFFNEFSRVYLSFTLVILFLFALSRTINM